MAPITAAMVKWTRQDVELTMVATRSLQAMGGSKTGFSALTTLRSGRQSDKQQLIWRRHLSSLAKTAHPPVDDAPFAKSSGVRREPINRMYIRSSISAVQHILYKKSSDAAVAGSTASHPHNYQVIIIFGSTQRGCPLQALASSSPIRGFCCHLVHF